MEHDAPHAAVERAQKLFEVEARVRDADDWTTVKDIDLAGFRGGRLRDEEEVAEDLGVVGQDALVEAEGGVLCDNDDIPVVKPDVGVPLNLI